MIFVTQNPSYTTGQSIAQSPSGITFTELQQNIDQSYFTENPYVTKSLSGVMYMGLQPTTQNISPSYTLSLTQNIGNSGILFHLQRSISIIHSPSSEGCMKSINLR